jgi:hypothetical protein
VVETTELGTRVEITKLARELGVDEEQLAYLGNLPAATVRDFRDMVSAAAFARHEPRLRRIAGLSKLLPVQISSRIAEHALGPVLSARIASVLEPADAVRLAGHLSPGFLSRLAVSLDPARTAPIVRALPAERIVAVGRDLLGRAEYLTLARFVSVVDVDTTLAVVAKADPADLLQVALFTEDPAALNAIVARLDDDKLQELVDAAASSGQYCDAVALLGTLSPASQARLLARVAHSPVEVLTGFVHAVIRLRAWRAVFPAIDVLPAEKLDVLVNLPEILDVAVIDDVITQAHEQDAAAALISLVLSLDEEHLLAVEKSEQLADPTLREWLRTTSGVAPRLVDCVLRELGFG